MAGIATVMVANNPERALWANPPRVLFTPFPRGITVGPAGNLELQRAVLRRTVELLSQVSGDGVRETWAAS